VIEEFDRRNTAKRGTEIGDFERCRETVAGEVPESQERS
jgi:hypothetical protein